jgi:glycosyltransferase involved in cell wall biosynthesis
MNILMMTNTFTPHIGGVARSVQAFTEVFRQRGHRTLVVAPVYENMTANEVDVIRIPAIKPFNQSDFSVVLPIPGFLTIAVDKFCPDIVHAYHPFLIGGTALHISHILKIPLVFTHHTMYEQYTCYVLANSKPIKRFVVMAGYDRQKTRSYYTEVAENLPKDTGILTAGCAKCRYNKLALGDIGGLPRVLDAGHCSDSYSLAVIALKLKEVFGLF